MLDCSAIWTRSGHIVTIVAAIVMSACGGGGTTDTSVGVVDPDNNDTPSPISDAELLGGSLPVVIHEFEDTQFVGTAWLALADGSLSNDFSGIRELGVEVSRETNPAQWGAYRRGPGDFEIQRRLGIDNEFVTLEAEYPTTNSAPLGCFTSAFGSVFAINGGDATDTFCFNTAGFYATDSSSGLIINPGASNANASTGSEGTFGIDGFSITFRPDGAAPFVASFADFSLPERLVQSISIDNVVLQSDAR